MFKLTTSIVLLFLTLCLLESADSKKNTFAIQWPVGVCRGANKPTSKCNIPKINTWTIHGLWPSTRKTPFNIDPLLSIRKKLDALWPDVTSNNNPRFWSHEWVNHGVYYNHMLEYFKKNLKLIEDYQLFQILQRGGITPSNTKTYTLAQVNKAVFRKVDKKVNVRCADNNNKLLQEIRICLDDQYTATVDCDGTSNCNPDKLTTFILYLVLTLCLLETSYGQNTFAIQWPVGVCKSANKQTSQCNIPRRNTWTIHGLWPPVTKTPTSVAFSVNPLATIRAQLNALWPDVTGNKNPGFWSHEWGKHGVYYQFKTQNQLLEFFTTNLNLINGYQLYTVLQRGGITPSNTKTYTLAQVNSAVSGAVRANVNVRCANNNLNVLQEIRVCFDAQYTTTVNCGGKSNCGAQVYYYAS
ncbi:unnamed protein product [Brassicogethes aeneus]|uniref:Uncharacterized protein n=1 Tax=Brassicogethes aeneus TaxID=1431903 RepID=A0A9P0B736_BRAAE|nr:unnamed protein product [Brassicogethes aeneus]